MNLNITLVIFSTKDILWYLDNFSYVRIMDDLKDIVDKMIFNKENYIKTEINRLAETNHDCIYCFCDTKTIPVPLETYYDSNSIPNEQFFEGNMVWLANKEHDTNYYLFTNGKWFPALITSDEELYSKVMKEVREHKINEIID